MRMLLRRRRWRGMLMLLRGGWPGGQQHTNENQSGHGPRDLCHAQADTCALPLTARVLDAKRCMGGTWIERGAALVCARDCPRGNRWRDDERRRWRCGYRDRIQPDIDDRERNITRLVAQHATGGIDGNTLRRAVMLV